MAELPYDPQKAHEAYLRRRQLLGRQPGKGDIPAAPHKKAAVVIAPVKPKKTTEKRQAEADARVAALKARLDKLRKVLAELVKQAQARSGVEPKSDKPSAAPAKKGSSDLSAQDKREAAKKAKDRYEKEKKVESPSEKTKNLELDIKKVQEKIQKIRDELKQSISQARNQSTQ